MTLKIKLKIISFFVASLTVCYACSKDKPGNTNTIFERIKFEAEYAEFTGSAKIDRSISGYSGKGYVTDFNNSTNKLIFNVMNDSLGVYDIYLQYTTSTWGETSCNIKINNSNAFECNLNATGESFKEIKITSTNLLLNKNIVTITPIHTNFAIDYIRITPYTLGPVSNELVTPDPSPEAVALYNYLKSVYGKKIHSGATAITGSLDEENWIYQQTGKYPALAGFDFMNHTRGYSWENKDDLVKNAKYWWSQNGMVVAHWHWRDPSRATDAFYSLATSYSERTSFDASKINDTLSLEYAAMIQDMDTIAAYLKQLRDAHVPVLWRPFHEASGKWFWWGYKGADVTKKLWQVMFNRFVNYHGLNNLIWIWTSDTKSDDITWYPGDDMVDIIGMDIYPPNGDFSSQVANFNQVNKDFSGNKLVTLSECGSIPDPDNLVNDHAGWLWFMPWYGNYTRSDAINPVSQWQKIMNHNYVITLDEMPDLKIQ